MQLKDKKIKLSLRWPCDAPNTWVPWKFYVSAIKQPTIAQESPHYNLITIRRWNYFRSIPSNVISTAPNSDLGLNITDRQTDRRTLLWHHRATRSIAR